MLVNVFYIVSGLLLLAIGAEALVRGSTGLALRLHVTALVIGLTIVAFGTGSPELVLSIEASRTGNSDIVLGNVVGSNISNIALVLGAAALVRPMHVRSELIRREVPLMIGVTLLLWAMLLDKRLSRPEGFLLVVGTVTYTVFSYLVARKLREYGHKYVKEKFLITRSLRRYLLLFHALSHPGENIIYFDRGPPPFTLGS
jgi:cation:H+ antiporter